MQGNSLQRTPERPGRGKRGLLEVASPFSLFAKELPPITPPRNQWDSSSTFSGCPGFTGLSPAVPGFTTPKLAAETTATPSGGRAVREKGGEADLVKLEDQQQGSKATSRISLFSPSQHPKMESPRHWAVGSAGAQHAPNRDLFYGSIDRMKSPAYSTPEGSRNRHQQLDTRAALDAEHHASDQPLNLQTSTRRAARETRQSNAQSVQQSIAQQASYAEEDKSAISAVEHDARADLQQPAQTAARGWETKLNSAGAGGRMWQYGQLKSPPEGSSLLLAAPLNQSLAAATASMTSPALKAVMAAGGRVDHRLQSAAAAAALSAAAAATPVSRRLSSTSSGQGDSVVPPTTPDDEAKTRSAAGPVSEQPKRCNCKKSRCLKLYCDCFAAGQYCKHACSCQSCLNNADNKDIVVSMRDQVRQRNPQAFQEKIEKQANGQGSGVSGLHKRGCHCKKSHCKKKYCECFQAGVNCGVHCKCDECHNTVEDGLPPTPRPSGKQSASASANALTVVANPTERNKTSPGTPPAPGKETTSLDARRTSSRSVKRKAWTSSTGAPATSEQPRRLTTPSTDSSASQHRALSSGVLSPPDMVWPANTLAQAQGHVLGSAGSSAAPVLSPAAPFDHGSISRILGRTALEQVCQLQQLQSVTEAPRLLSASLDGRREGLGPHCATQLDPSPQKDAQSPVEDRVQVEGIGQCFVSSMHASRMPASQTLFPSPLLGLDTQTRPDASDGPEQPLLVMGRVYNESSLRSRTSEGDKDMAHESDRGVLDSATFQDRAPRFHAGTASSPKHPESALLKPPGGVVALPRARHEEFSLAELAAAEEALCTATPWTEQHDGTLHRPGHGAVDMNVEHMMLGPEGVIPCAKNLLERAQSVTFKTEDPMHLDQANKRGLWMGQEIGRKRSSHASKSSQVRKLTDVPRLGTGGRRGTPQRSASLPAPQASITGTQSALTRSHSSAEDADAEMLSPSAPSNYGQGQMLRMGAGRTLISPK